MQDPLSIANYFINKSFSQGVAVTPMKLVKLVYIAHGWHLGITKEPLLTEVAEAWKYGPVIPSVYHSYKSFGNQPITKITTLIDSNQVNDAAVKLLLDKVWDIYSKYDGVQLSALTHKQGTPWDIVWNQKGGKYHNGAIIPNDLIASHYKEIINGFRTNTTV
jgi:uncharacterized phage-associated protein